ncbi:TPR repeat protein [Thermogutta terrifontis]|uniref:TPR repeat protein n=2 Tax=Thermogutta TaxID=1676125 RepID=A0A286RLD8_9BACT|nr:tetratricopeptide repeat protein [Thermogutta terrifontis]ASV76737.1 TPR repeat protein [Thermogutta terrifontis]
MFGNFVRRVARIHILLAILGFLVVIVIARSFVARLFTDPLTQLAHPSSKADPEFKQVWEQARTLLQQITHAFPDDPQTWNLAGQIHSRFGRASDAKACWKRCLAIDPKFVEGYHRLGFLATEAGDFKLAAEYYRQACKVDPNSAVYPTLLAEVLMQDGQLEEARHVLEKCLQKHPEAVAARALLAQVLSQLREDGSAIFHAQQVVRVTTEVSNVYQVLAVSLERQGRREEAAEARKKFLELKKLEEETHRKQLKEDSPIEAARQALGRAYIGAARIFAAYGQFDNAQALLANASRLCSQDGEPMVLQAWLQYQCGSAKEALRLLEAIAEQFRDEPATLMAVAELARQWGETQLAKRVGTRLITIRPREPAGYAFLAGLSLQDPTAEESFAGLVCALRAATLAPNAENFALVAMCAKKSGDDTTAKAALQEAERLDPDNEIYARLLKEWWKD